MKKLYVCLTLLAGLLPIGNTINAQVAVSSPMVSTTISNPSVLTYDARVSPDLSHIHDPEQCLTDHITKDWITQAGIADAYAESITRQNNLVRRGGGGGDRSSYTVPVIFHVIYNTDEENVSAIDIEALLDAVNEDFAADNADIDDARDGFGFVGANADIEFCLATTDEDGEALLEPGIHRVETDEVWYEYGDETNKMKSSIDGGTGTEPWDRDQYLNVWICDITNGALAGVAGYAYLPTVEFLPPSNIDGIVIDYNLGLEPSNRVLTHEIGHFLGLPHTWGNDGGCDDDDGLDDTPSTAGPSFDYAGTCSGSQTTCPGIQTQYENYMDYSNCTVMFSDDQVDLMHLVLEDSRLELTESTKCVPLVETAPIADFEGDPTIIGTGGAVGFDDLSDNFPTTWTWTVAPMTGVSYILGTDAGSEDPIIQFDEEGFYTVTLNVSNGAGSDSESKVDYIQVIEGGGDVSCDTLRNYTDEELAGSVYYGVTGEAGYYPAQFTLDEGGFRAEFIAEGYTSLAPIQIAGINIPIIQVDDILGASVITFHVWDDAGGEPGTILGSTEVPLADLNAGFYNNIEFTPAISVVGDFWVGFEFDYSAGFDTIIFTTTAFDDRPSGESSTILKFDPETDWLRTSEIFGSAPDCSLIMDVLVGGDGGPPISLVNIPVGIACEGVDVELDGSTSINATDYLWEITDGDDTYFFAGDIINEAFDAGTWDVSLTVEGACISDVSAGHSFTINDELDLEVVVSNENCINEDGRITFIASGGDGGPYNYSIDDGLFFVATNVFEDLASGTYNYVVTDDNLCEISGVATIGVDSDFTPGISDDVTIDLGMSTELTVAGGISWSWYEDGDLIGSDASITVSPVVTTTYTCIVTNDDGCVAEVDVVVTVDNGAGINDFELTNFVQIYPNPTNGELNLSFDLSEKEDLNITFVNVIGENVIAVQLSQVQQDIIQIDLSKLSNGIYFVNIKAKNGVSSQKIILNR